MKKIIGIAAVAAMVAASAFASGITFSAWTYAGVHLFDQTATTTKSSGNTTTTSSVVGTPTWYPGGHVEVNIAGSTDNMGFELDIDSNDGTLCTDNNSYIWGKVGMFKFDFGKLVVDTLRGGGTTWLEEDVCPDGNGTGLIGQDYLFKRLQVQGGAVVEITPVEGLFFGASIDGAPTNTTTYPVVNGSATTTDDKTTTVFTDAQDAYYNMQYAAGYTIKDIAQFKAQYVGSWRAFQGGIKLLMLKGNTIELGATIPVVDKDTNKNTGFDSMFVGALSGSSDKIAYSLNALGVFGVNDGTTLGELSSVGGTVVGGDARVSYDFSIIKAGVTGTFAYATYESTKRFGGSFFLEKDLSGGYIFASVRDVISDNDTQTVNEFSIPVGATFSL